MKKERSPENENEHDRRRKLRGERERRWRKEMRHPRMIELDDRFVPLLPRRFQP
jgi:hypothetical protein